MSNKIKTVLQIFKDNNLMQNDKPVISMTALATFCGQSNFYAQKLGDTINNPSPSAIENGISYKMTDADYDILISHLSVIRSRLSGVIADAVEMKEGK